MNSRFLFFINSRKIIINLILALALFFLFNWIFFSTKLYSRIFLFDSSSGQVKLMMSAEKTRIPPPKEFKTAIIFGDSRLAEGFSAKTANIEGHNHQIEFVNSAIPSTTPRCWYYFLQYLDKDINKYDYIILGLPSLSKILSDDLEERLLDIDYLSPLVSPKDYISIARSYRKFETQLTVLRYLMAKGFVYKYDFQDIFLHPKERLKSILNPITGIGWFHNYDYQGRLESLSGVTWNSETHIVSYSQNYPKDKKDFIEKYANSLNIAPLKLNLQYNLYWIEKILKSYEGKKTKIVIFQLPSGPLPTTLENEQILPDYYKLKEKYSSLIILPASKFRELEHPDFYFDFLHLNSKGRERMTRELSAEIISLKNNFLDN